MIGFAEVIKEAVARGRPSVLFGNGFSRAWSNEIFSYENLLKAADFGGRESDLKKIFARLDTFDFEAVMRSLVSAQLVLEVYGGDDALIEKIVGDQDSLKDALISVISKTHPDRPSAVDDDEYRSARVFCSQFFNVFTLNYDLLLHWIRNKNDLVPPVEYKTDDGFRRTDWLGFGTDQQIYFLHGALHLFENGGSVEKHASNNSGVAIIDSVRKNLNEGKFPIFVSEPSSEKKKRKIERNPYLNFCYSALRDQKGDFFVHGHSFDSNDKHVFDQLNKSGVTNYFVGIFGDEDSLGNQQIKGNARAWLERRGSSVTFYDAATAAIWKK